MHMVGGGLLFEPEPRNSKEEGIFIYKVQNGQGKRIIFTQCQKTLYKPQSQDLFQENNFFFFCKKREQQREAKQLDCGFI